MGRAAVFLALVWAGQLAAQDVRPIARPDPPSIAPAGDIIRPIARPVPSDTTARSGGPSQAEPRLYAFSAMAPRQSLRPRLRPATVEAEGTARRLARARGQVCGDPAIQGEVVGFVDGPGACGIDGAVRVRSVSGVTLRARPLIDCPTARALKTWIDKGVRPAVGSEGGGVSSLRVVSHYACRPRNNQPGARLSEHGFGRAIDIAGIRLRDGSEMTLLTDWDSAEDGEQLRRMWRAACGPFGTVLGPDANRFHRDHFHFDTARYRRGSFCR